MNFTANLDLEKPEPLPSYVLCSCTITISISIVCIGVVLVCSLLLLSCAEACEQHDKHAQEQQDHGSEGGPHAGGVVGITTGAIRVDVVLDDLVQS